MILRIRPRYCGRRSGVILIVTLWILGLLVFYVINLNHRVRLGMELTDYRRDQLKAELLLQAGLARGLAILRQDGDAAVDYGGEGWSEVILIENEGLLSSEYLDGEKVSIHLRIRDESSKLNVNKTPKKILDLLFKNLYGSAVDHQALAEAVVDWRDQDDQGSAEKDYYQSLETPYSPRNGALRDLREMLAIRDVTQTLFDGEDMNGNGVLDDNEDDGANDMPDDDEDGELRPGLKDVLTVQGGGEINVNTVPAVVLASVFEAVNGIDELRAQALVGVIERSRSGADGITGTQDDVPFRNSGEISAALRQETEIDMVAQCRDNLQIPLGVRSEAFQISAGVALKNKNITMSAEGIAPREGNEIQLAWWRKNR